MLKAMEFTPDRSIKRSLWQDRGQHSREKRGIIAAVEGSPLAFDVRDPGVVPKIFERQSQRREKD